MTQSARSVRPSGIVVIGIVALAAALYVEPSPFRLMGLSVFKWLFLLATCLLVLAIPTRGFSVALPANPFLYVYVLCNLMVAVIHRTPTNTTAAISHSLCVVFAAVFLTYAGMGGKRLVVRAFVACGFVVALVDIALMLSPSLPRALGLTCVSLLRFEGKIVRRLFGVSNDPNFTMLTLAIPLLLLLAELETGGDRSSLGWVKVGSLTVTCIWTLSRGGLLGLAAGLAYILVSLKGGRRSAALLGAIGALSAIMRRVDLLPVMIARFGNIDARTDERLMLWRVALGRLRTGASLWGTGFPVMAEGARGLLYVHNTWLEVALGNGLVGFASYVLAWVWAVRRLARVDRHNRIAVTSAMIATAIQITFLSASGLNLVWFVLLLPEVMSSRVGLGSLGGAIPYTAGYEERSRRCQG